MPEHGFHAVFGKLVVDAVMPEVAQPFAQGDFAVEVLKNWEELQKLVVGYEDQILGVGIQHLAVAVEDADDLQPVAGRIRHKGSPCF
jgi:hypothetical protein